jgi:hypothetical protein
VADRSDVDAVLMVGVYGTGKTSVVEEIADILEDRGVRYAAIDLDWLRWFDPGFGDHSAGVPVMLKNVEAVVGNYYETGIRRFVLAGAMGSSADLDDLRGVLGMPMTVVRLTLPLEEIERRLSNAVTAGRNDDLQVARKWLAEGRAKGSATSSSRTTARSKRWPNKSCRHSAGERRPRASQLPVARPAPHGVAKHAIQVFTIYF